ncbi:MAG TPA: hypothetical protein VD962_06085 [Rubricoccaceae bacterium]|nr:hypothetical protein [Rubricoccaceae bacterium]
MATSIPPLAAALFRVVVPVGVAGIVVLCGALFGCRTGSALAPQDPSHASTPAVELDEPRDTTVWVLRPSLKHDALAFLGVLTGDPFYVERYPDEYARFDALLTPAARAALAELKREVKDENGGIISAFLTLVFSASDAETIPEMRAALDDPGPLKASFEQTPYASAWPLFEIVVPELRVLLGWYEDVGFPAYWEAEVRPRAEARIAELAPQLPGYNVLGETARLTGRPAPLDTLTVYVLHFVKPHGIKVTGTRFLTATTWPFDVVLPDAVHEMMHPPYDLAADTELRTALEGLRADSFLMERVEHHDPSLGYNTFEGFVEEDVVQALEQVVLERLGVAREPRVHWCRADGGMHVLAVALYRVMKEGSYAESGETVRDFLIREVTRGALQPGSLRAHYEAFYAGAPCG